MNWHCCIESTEKSALDLCCGSMNKGAGYGSGGGYGGSNGESSKEW